MNSLAFISRASAFSGESFSQNKVLRVGRTLADLEAAETIATRYIA